MSKKELYHLANIRELLTEGFDDEELRALCFDVPDFRPVYHRLARNSGKTEIVAQLLEYVEKTLQVDTLLALAKTHNPARYEMHGPYYINDPVPALQKQVTDLAKRLTALTSPSSLTREQQYQIAFHWVELGRKDSLRTFDLQGADLRGVDLVRADLRGADLRNADLSGAYLSGANLRGVNLSKANLTGADLREADLTAAKLNEATLNGVNLSKANLREAVLMKAMLIGADLRGADLTGVLTSDVWSLYKAIMPDGSVHS